MSLLPMLLLLAIDANAKPADALEKIAPHAAGICLAEVVDVVKYDDRPMDGDAGVVVKLKILRSSGTVKKEVRITTAFGGLRPPGTVLPKLPIGPVKPDSLEKGKRYWLAFSSKYADYNTYPQGVINFWPQFEPKIGDLFDKAVTAKRYEWQPQHDPKTGLTHGHRVNAELQHVRVHMMKDTKQLWEKTLTGKPLSNSHYDPSLTPYNHMGFPAKLPRSGKLLAVNLTRKLPVKNEHDLPAGDYNITTGLDPETGDRLAVWIMFQKSSTQALQREYQPKTGRLLREHRYEWVRRDDESRQLTQLRTEKTFDPKTGKVTSAAVYRHDGKRWVRIDSGRK